jgi:transcriptional regulator with XRE-family HTH domain
MNRNDSIREVLGERLRAFREDRGLSAYKVAQKGNLRIEQVKAVESGETNYTIDIFFKYIYGCDLYMYFAEKNESTEATHDFEGLKRKGVENDPNL